MSPRTESFTPPQPLRSGWRSRFLLALSLAVIPLAPAWAQLDKFDTAPITRTAPGGFTAAEHTVIKLAPGVEWTQDITPASAPGGPLVVSVVRVSPNAAKKDRLRVALGYGHVWENNATQGRETVSGIADRYDALVAMNASFFTFQGGNPLGLCVENGEAITEPMLGRTALLIDEDGKGKIAAFTGSGTVTAPNGATFPIMGFNRKPGKGNEMLLFTPRFYGATLPALGRVEASVSDIPTLGFNTSLTGKVVQNGTGGGTSLSPQTVVLSGGGKAALFLSENATPGNPLTIQYTVSPSLVGVRQAVAGGPRLVAGGKVAVNDTAEGFVGAFSTGRHPRSAVGVAKDGSLLLMTVDGRQPLVSKGTSLAETAALLVKYGAVEGVNLDGGGSTTLAIKGQVTNSPSDISERPVANALVLTTEEKSESDPSPEITLPPLVSLMIGQVQQCNLSLNGKRRDTENTVWSVRGKVGFVSQSGRFLALRAGNGSIVATQAGGQRFVIPVTVTAPPAPLPVPSPTPKSTP